MIDDALLDAEEKMEKAVNVAKEDMGSIRTGRANPAMFNKVNIEYYGSMTPVTQVASINTPEPRLVVIKPYEASTLRDIETAIRNSDLGVNPTNDGTIIRVAVPQLTEERRRDLVHRQRHRVHRRPIDVERVDLLRLDDADRADLDRLVANVHDDLMPVADAHALVADLDRRTQRHAA